MKISKMGGNVHSHLPRRTPTHPPIAPPYPMKLDDYTRDVVESNEMERSAPLRVKIKPTVRQGRGLRFLHRALPTRPSTEPNRTGQDRGTIIALLKADGLFLPESRDPIVTCKILAHQSFG